MADRGWMLLLAAALLTGCSSAPGTASTAPPASPPAASPATPAASATPADPVAILRQAGATPDPGTVYGGHDAYGDRMASGSFPGGESVTVYTSGGRDAYMAAGGRVAPDDTTGVILIPARLAVIIANAGGVPSGWGGPSPQEIASRVGGTALPPR